MDKKNSWARCGAENKILIIIQVIVTLIQLRNIFYLASILSFLDLNVTKTASSITQFSFSIFILSLISLLSLLNVFCLHFCTYIFIIQGKYESKFLWLQNLFTFIRPQVFFYIIIELLIGFFFLWSPEGNSRREVRREPLINLILYNPPLSPFSLSLFLSLSIIPIPIYSLSLRSAEQTLYVCTFWGYFQIKSAVSKAGRRSPFQFTKWVLGTSDY